MNPHRPRLFARRALLCGTLASLVLFSAPIALRAQTNSSSLSGTVTGNVAGAPLAGALVIVVGTTHETATDSQGRFQFAALPPGPHTLRVSYLGFEPKDVALELPPQRALVQDIRLGDDMVTLTRVVVEGQRAGQARALNEQRTSESLKNILASDEFGRFPDQNAAEALQRVVGVSLVRDEGEGQTIWIRGVEENLNSTSLNGISLPGTRGGREVLLDMIPSDLLDTVEVSKVFTPDAEGQGIGGRVNLKTLTAFSREGRIARLSAEGQYNEGSDRWGSKVSATYGDKFGGGKWGLLASGTYSDRHMHTRGLSVASWTTKNNFLIPGGAINFDEIDLRRVRDGFNASVDFRPSTSDAFYARGVFTRLRNTRLRLRSAFANNAASTTPTSDRTGNVAARTVVINMQSLREESKTWTIFAGGEHRRPTLQLDYLVSYARGQLIPTTVPVPFTSGNTSWAYDLGDYSSPVFTGPGLSQQPSAYRFATYKWQHDNKHEVEITAEANLRKALELAGHRGYWKVGGKYRAKHKVNDQAEETWADASGGTTSLADVASFGPVAGSSFPSIDPLNTAPLARMDAFFQNNPTKFRHDAVVSGRAALLNDFIDNEDVAAAYAMGGIDTTRLGLVAGARVERTMFDSRGWETVNENLATLKRIKATRNYTSVMPSIVGRYHFNSQLQARFSWSGTQARPKFGNSAFSRTIDDLGNYSQGNPNLEPYKASNWDASLEYYPKSLGVMSLNLFQKDIKDFVTTQTIVGGAPDGIHDLRMPVNGKSAKVRGVELEWQQQFRMLPSPFDGLGLYSNYTLTKSEADYGANLANRKDVFANVSERMANLALAYEKYGFFIRVSANYRSEYLTSIRATSATDVFVPSQWRLDASTSYRLTKRLTWYAEGINLTDTPSITHIRNTRGLVAASYYSWSANTGIRVKF